MTPHDTPEAVQNEEELNENTTKGQNTPHHDGREGLVHASLVWYLPRDLVHSHWELVRLMGQEGTTGEHQVRCSPTDQCVGCVSKSVRLGIMRLEIV